MLQLYAASSVWIMLIREHLPIPLFIPDQNEIASVIGFMGES